MDQPGWSWYAEFGRRLRRARLGAGLSQEALGDRVGLSRTSIANIEGGKQRLLAHMVTVLASALGLTPEILLPKMTDSADQLDAANKSPEENWVSSVMEAADKGE